MSKSDVGNKCGIERKKKKYCICAHLSCHRISGVVGFAVIRSATDVCLQRGQLARRFISWGMRKSGLGRLANSVGLKRQPFQNTDM